MMKTIQMTIDENLLIEMDQVVRTEGTNRSAFIRAALEQALRKYRIAQMEKRDAEGYATLPSQINEFAVWESEQEWEGEWNEEK